MPVFEKDEIGRRMFPANLLLLVCTCTKGWGWTANPLGHNYVWVHDKCMKPSRYSAIEICEECEGFFFWPFNGLRWACPQCLPAEDL